MAPPTPVKVRGKTYPSLRRAAAAHGLKYSTLWRRLSAGHSLSKALSPSFQGHPSPLAKSVRLGNKRYPSTRQACLALGLSPALVQQRMVRGWSLSDAIHTPLGAGRSGAAPRKSSMRKQVWLNGEQFDSLRAAATARGLSPKLVYQRLKYGWAPERALELGKDEHFAWHGQKKKLPVRGA